MTAYERALDALGDRTRRQILGELRAGPAPVAELAARLPVSRPAVSQHLKVLLAAGLVGYEEAGTRNIYRVETQGIVALREWLDDLWETALGSFETYAHARGADDGTDVRH